MGWFWASATPAVRQPEIPTPSPSPSDAAPVSNLPSTSQIDEEYLTYLYQSRCPVQHGQPTNTNATPTSEGSCPIRAKDSPFYVPPSNSAKSQNATPSAPEPEQKSVLSMLNPLNYMFADISQSRAPNQTVELSVDREPSSIPRGDSSGAKWEYPSPQQMYNAMLRKGYMDTPQDAVESMVSVHNFLNEGAWQEIVDWERTFSKGLVQGWQKCRRGSENLAMDLERERMRSGVGGGIDDEPRLARFMGRPQDLTPKAQFFQLLGRIYPSKFGTAPPFDRHDWYVLRKTPQGDKEIRYVIDYYSGPPEPTGEPVFFLDIRPAVDTPTAAAERLLKWGGDIWWRASGGAARENQ
ncbi:cytochrome c heme lyase [Trichophyton rubrum]|uniref:Holocytochrome c-type synthase n=1 Tax=Trichophyton rubrum TaxID=5551 RepID=A0A178EVA4_TRIRU|nr:cytochrome c heme lyase [Trichophyton rubrum]